MECGESDKMTPQSNVLPGNMYSWAEIGKFERLNLERLAETRKNTNAILVAKANEMGFPSAKAFAAHYNNISNGLITDRAINLFLYHSKLEPIAHLIRWHIKDVVSRDKGMKREVGDFGLLKSHYESYRRTGEAPAVANRGRTKENFTPTGENARTKLDLPKTLAYQRFANTIKAANKQSRDKVTIPQMILLAIEEYMQNRPELFGEPETQIASDSSIRIKDNKMLTAHISPDTMKKLSALLARYNSVSTIAITQSQLVEKAILQMIERSPVELSDPELARELKRQEDKS